MMAQEEEQGELRIGEMVLDQEVKEEVVLQAVVGQLFKVKMMAGENTHATFHFPRFAMCDTYS